MTVPAGARSAPVEERFTQALHGLVEQLKADRSILAAVLCGSLSHDRVWDKSDIDLVLVTIDDRKIGTSGKSLYADGVNVHALLVPRTEFRKIVEGSLRNSFVHSFLARGRLLYTHDQSLADLLGTLGSIGERDTQVQLLAAATRALGPLYKARKWFTTRADLEYTALYLLYTATPLAELEVISARQLVDREVILAAMKLNPPFFRSIYTDLLNSAKTMESVKTTLDSVDRYLAERARTVFAPVLDYLRDVNDVRTASEIEDHFVRNFGIEGVTAACEYLADQGWIGKTGASLQVTRRSNALVEELAFFHHRE
jgi:hypothetical protein